MPFLERRGTPRRSDSSLSGTSQPSFLERFYFSALGYAFVAVGAWHMLLSALAGYWLGVVLGLSLAKIGLTALSMVYVAKQSKRLPWLLEKLVLWGHGIVKKLFTVLRFPMYLFFGYISLCLLVRVWSSDRLFRIDGMPSDCSVAPSPVHGCHRIEIVIVPPSGVSDYGGGRSHARLLHASRAEVQAATKAAAEFKAGQADKAGATGTTGTTGNAGKAGTAGKAGKAGKATSPKNSHVVVTTLDECLRVDSVAGMVHAWADGDAAFVRRLKWSLDADGSIFGHWRVLSTVFGFADDLVVHTRIDGSSSVKAIVVDAQSQLRLGIGDLGVNKRRLARLARRVQELCGENKNTLNE